jgi:predicted O-methyltransferase YrrM
VEDYQLLIDLHKSANRQGPGGDAETEKALSLAVIDRAAPLEIADIGCGTGASTLLLARLLKAHITAVDFLQDFLEVLESRAENMGLSEKITTLSCNCAIKPARPERWSTHLRPNGRFTQQAVGYW